MAPPWTMPKSATAPWPCAATDRRSHRSVRASERSVASTVAGIGQALVERVQDVDAERVLDRHADLGGREPERAVHVGAELDAVLADLPELGEAPYLEAPESVRMGPFHA